MRQHPPNHHTANTHTHTHTQPSQQSTSQGYSYSVTLYANEVEVMVPSVPPTIRPVKPPVLILFRYDSIFCINTETSCETAITRSVLDRIKAMHTPLESSFGHARNCSETSRCLNTITCALHVTQCLTHRSGAPVIRNFGVRVRVRVRM